MLAPIAGLSSRTPPRLTVMSIPRAGLSSSLRLLLALFFISDAAVRLASCAPDAPCYDPSGARADGFYPCDDTAYLTMCCPGGWTCFSNSLCVVTTPDKAYPGLTVGNVTRGACTNPLWNNAICGANCLSGINADGDMVACGNNEFCCAGDYQAGQCNCSTAAVSNGSAFIISPGVAQTIIGVTGGSFTGTPTYLVTVSTAPTSYTTSKRSRSRATVTSTQRSGELITSVPQTSIQQTTSAGTGTETDISGSQTSSPTSSGTAVRAQSTGATSGRSKAVGLGVGLGIGIPAAALAAGLLYVFLYYRPRRNRQHQGGKEPPQGQEIFPSDAPPPTDPSQQAVQQPPPPPPQQQQQWDQGQQWDPRQQWDQQQQWAHQQQLTQEQQGAQQQQWVQQQQEQHPYQTAAIATAATVPGPESGQQRQAPWSDHQYSDPATTAGHGPSLPSAVAATAAAIPRASSPSLSPTSASALPYQSPTRRDAYDKEENIYPDDQLQYHSGFTLSPVDEDGDEGDKEDQDPQMSATSGPDFHDGYDLPHYGFTPKYD